MAKEKGNTKAVAHASVPKKGASKKKKAVRKSLDQQNFTERSMKGVMAAASILAGRGSKDNVAALDNFSVTVTDHYAPRAAIIAKLLGKKKVTDTHFDIVRYANTSSARIFLGLIKTGRGKKAASKKGKKTETTSSAPEAAEGDNGDDDDNKDNADDEAMSEDYNANGNDDEEDDDADPTEENSEKSDENDDDNDDEDE